MDRRSFIKNTCLTGAGLLAGAPLLRDWHHQSPAMVIDFTRYDLTAKEPGGARPDHPVKHWSLINRINQKGLRPEDKPVMLKDLSAEEQELIYKYCPELKA